MDIEKNIKLHNKIAKKYEKTHGEIYNNIEQSRLVVDLHQSLSFVKNRNRAPIIGNRIKDESIGKFIF